MILFKEIDRENFGECKERISAVRLYEKFGFEFDGQVFGSEHIMRLEY